MLTQVLVAPFTAQLHSEIWVDRPQGRSYIGETNVKIELLAAAILQLTDPSRRFLPAFATAAEPDDLLAQLVITRLHRFDPKIGRSRRQRG